MDDSRDKLDFGRLLLAHHQLDEIHHCYRFVYRKTELFFCARCVGLYSTLGITLAFDLMGYRISHEARWIVAFSFVVPAVIDWARSKILAISGKNWFRTLTGAFAGVGLAVAFGDYFRDERKAYVWVLWIALTAIISLVWWCHRRI